MKTFEEIISFESLYRAHRRARLGKRHKKEVIEFELNLSQNLWQLHYDLKYGKYQVGGYHKFMIYDPKEREIQAIPYRDRVVQHALCDNYLIPLLEKKLIFDNAACRKNKGTQFALDRLSFFMKKFYRQHKLEGYFIKLDASKYFNNIDHAILKSKLAKIVKDEKVLGLIEKIIDSYSYSEGKGLPMGNQSSQSFALLMLDGFDRFIKEKMRVKYYVRYMDDIIMIVEDKSFARDIVRASREFLQTMGVRLNPKSQISTVKNGVIFLGRKMFLSEGKVVLKVKRELKVRIVQKLKLKVGQKQDVQSSRVSYAGFFCHCDSRSFFKYLCQKFFEASKAAVA